MEYCRVGHLTNSTLIDGIADRNPPSCGTMACFGSTHSHGIGFWKLVICRKYAHNRR